MTHTNKKAPAPTTTQSAFHTDTNDLDFATGARPRKALATLKAQFALRGFSLECNHHADNLEVTYWVSKWGQAKAFFNLSDVQAFLLRIGGAHE